MEFSIPTPGLKHRPKKEVLFDTVEFDFEQLRPE
jgi:hypothetical protein